MRNPNKRQRWTYWQSRNRITDVKNEPSATKGGDAWTGRFRPGLTYTHFCVYNRQLMRTYCSAQGTLLHALRRPKWAHSRWALPHHRRGRRGQETKPGLSSGLATAKTPGAMQSARGSARKEDKAHPWIWCRRFVPAIISCHPQLSLSPRHITRITTVAPSRVCTRIKWEKEETVVLYLLRSS